MKDAALLANPMGAPEQMHAQLAVRAPSGAGARVLPLEGHFEAHAAKPPLDHEQALDLEGALELDAKGIARLVLLGRGTFRLRWRGFDDDAKRFRMLMAGRTVDQAGGICYGVALCRVESGADEDGQDTSPVEAARVMLGQLSAGGRDVTEFRKRLDELGGEFTAIRAGRPEGAFLAITFPLRMEALLRDLTAAIQAGDHPEESPIAGLERAIGVLRSRGEDVTAFQRELTELAAEFAAIRSAGGPQERIARFRPRLEALADRIRDRALAWGGNGGN